MRDQGKMCKLNYCTLEKRMTMLSRKDTWYVSESRLCLKAWSLRLRLSYLNSQNSNPFSLEVTNACFTFTRSQKKHLWKIFWLHTRKIHHLEKLLRKKTLSSHAALQLFAPEFKRVFLSHLRNSMLCQNSAASRCVMREKRSHLEECCVTNHTILI